MMNQLAPVTPRDHVRGAAHAPITLVEYGDYECSYCGAAYPIVKAVTRRLEPSVRFVFRNFPIRELHAHAELAAEAAEAAAVQGAFWPMHDLLFENQTELSFKSLVHYASRVVPDPMRWMTDMERRGFNGRVREDLASGARSGVRGTPTFFVNGVKHDGPVDERSLLLVIEAKLGLRALP